jgi:predicted hydrocarbon binding protein
VSQVTTPLEMVVNITGIALSGGGSAVAKSAAVTSAKTIAKASIKSQMIRKAKEMGKELLETAAENAASTVYEAQLTGEFSWEDLDPTGVANVVKAFNKPLCKDFK